MTELPQDKLERIEFDCYVDKNKRVNTLYCEQSCKHKENCPKYLTVSEFDYGVM